MRHASIQTTMNIYGKAMTDSKRQAHSKVVERVLNCSKNDQTADHKKPVKVIGSWWHARETAQPVEKIGCGGRI